MLHLQPILGLEQLTKAQMEHIFAKTHEMKTRLLQNNKKSADLKGKSIINLFFENSTRTRTSFELAGKYLGADVVNVSASTCSLSKGESLRDTLLNLQAMEVDAIVMRHRAEGAAHFAAKFSQAVIINAGDGAHEHPSQGLLDIFTMLEHLPTLSGKKVAIIGDIRHSRVARSNIWGLNKMGADVHLGGPASLMPPDIAAMGVTVHNNVEAAIEGADVVNVLRIQHERQKKGFFPTIREYARIFGLNNQRLKLAKKEALVMHPGPMNRGVEILPEVAYGEQSVIEQQVTNGLAVRMALLSLTLLGQ